MTGWWHALEWGSVPDWVGAGSTAAGLIAAALAAKYAWGQLQVVRTEAATQADLRRQEQASQVAVWLDKDRQGKFVALATNRSGLPVNDVMVRFIGPNNHNGLHIGVLPPSDGPMLLPFVTEFVCNAADTNPSVEWSWLMRGSVGPVKFAKVRNDPKAPVEEDTEKAGVAPKEEIVTGPLGLEVVFTDMNGIRWERDLKGMLSERPLEFEQFKGGVIAGGLPPAP